MPQTPTARPAAAPGGAPLPADEVDRLAVLHSLAVLDTAPEERFDALTRLAARLTGMPIALVSLVDEHRQWFKSRHGLAVQETPREQAFCAYAVLQPDEVLVVEDAAADPRFRDNPLVTGALGLRAYAGSPLVGSDGQPLGTLCVLDTRPRTPGADELEVLRTLARQVVAQLEASRSARRLAAAETALRRRAGRAPLPPPVEGLERALDRDELVVHFQPFWDVARHGGALTAALSGAEALVRWQHPERGLLLPEAFLPAVEAQGLSTRLGEAVLRAALTAVARWERRGLPDGFRVHVNVAAGQLHDGGVGAAVDRLLAETGVAPQRLCLEVTETALLDAEAFTPAAARELVDRGVGLALDDFGTGFSSLTQLRAYPFSCVKVDRSFVAGLGRDDADEAIVDAVVDLTKRLGSTPVCEGVETAGQLDHVVAAGCTTVQGWLLGRAVDAGTWERRLLAEREVVLPDAQPARRRASAGLLPGVPAS